MLLSHTATPNGNFFFWGGEGEDGGEGMDGGERVSFTSHHTISEIHDREFWSSPRQFHLCRSVMTGRVDSLSSYCNSKDNRDTGCVT